MKQAVCALGLAAIATTVDARAKSKFALNNVRQTKNRLEQVYGRGLVGMKNEQGKFEQSKLGWDKRRAGQLWTSMGGIQFDAESITALFYGFVMGMQYNDLSAIDSESESNCFYATYGLIQSVDQLMSDFFLISEYSGQYNWFNLVAYNPVHITGAASVTYEMCNGYQYMEQVTSLFSKDWAYLGELLVKDTLYGLLDLRDEIEIINLNLGTAYRQMDLPEEAPEKVDEDFENEFEDETNFEDFEENQEGENAAEVPEKQEMPKPNFYEAGKAVGRIVSRMFDTEIDIGA